MFKKHATVGVTVGTKSKNRYDLQSWGNTNGGGGMFKHIKTFQIF